MTDNSTDIRDTYRAAAGIFLDLSETVSGELTQVIEACFIGSYVYMVGVPVTVYKISKLPFCGSYRSAKRYCDLMVEAGSLEYTADGLVKCTEKGLATSDWYFKALFEMPQLVGGLSKEKNKSKIHSVK
ncbi:hypothetical protein N9X33_01500 [Alphaproteobacteria bacterium]|nr:hypothetical protein [Alphaproteobacteria bacterium]MDA8666392.1 hypothetical protein [Alphaproteobacteria bacterium]MDB2393539.1 hypothetical protein [Alphaproteobacteria bacterium]MDB2476799.1 hypothetical protein [Alphaproteobacteria bacterium]MDB2487248.1 hypothetical protein [Alphaproteobacteria bacterium]